MIFLTVLVGWIFLAPLLAERLIVEKHLVKADAILVLSGSAAYMERAQEAASAFKKGTAQKIFLTNDGLQGSWDEKRQRNPYFVEYERWELIRQGVPEEAIEILLTVVKGTNDEANLFAEVATKRRLKSLLLVTSAYHSRRALWAFERAMSRNSVSLDIGIKYPPIGQQTPPASTWWLSGRGWRMVGLECVKIVYYWLIW